MAPRGPYRLDDVSLTIEEDRVRFTVRLLGPPGVDVWVRAWVSDESGTLAETVAPKAMAGDVVKIEVPVPEVGKGGLACIRIESKPLGTEQILMRRLPRSFRSRASASS